MFSSWTSKELEERSKYIGTKNKPKPKSRYKNFTKVDVYENKHDRWMAILSYGMFPYGIESQSYIRSNIRDIRKMVSMGLLKVIRRGNRIKTTNYKTTDSGMIWPLNDK